jgi:integrase
MAHHEDFKGRVGRRHRARWPLLESGYQPQTVERYKRAVTRFMDWCSTTKQDAQNYDEFDELLADYLQNMHEEKRGKGKQLAKETLYGVYMYMPRATDKLYVSNRIVNRWCKGQLPESYPPLTWELAVTIAVQMVRNGHYRYGIATLVAFDCLLRIGEFTKLCAGDVAVPRDARMGAEYRMTTLAIWQAKTGRNQSVEVLNADVKQLLLALVARTNPKDKLFPGGSAGYRAVFKKVCAELGLSSKYVPHSLRHGGATRLHLTKWPLEDIMMRGRWASAKSARTYIQSGRAMLMHMKAPKKITDLAVVLAADVVGSITLSQKH